MHGIGNPLAPCGGAFDTDDNDVKRGDDETGWLVNGIMGSQAWQRGRNAIFIVFDEGNGPLTCSYDLDSRVDTAPGSLLPGADCYAPANFNGFGYESDETHDPFPMPRAIHNRAR